MKGRIPLFLALSFTVINCTGDPEPAKSSQVEPITNGTPSSVHSVVELLNVMNSTSCSGVVVAPRCIVTAAHCLGSLGILVTDVNGNSEAVKSYTGKHPPMPASTYAPNDPLLQVLVTDGVYLQEDFGYMWTSDVGLMGSPTGIANWQSMPLAGGVTLNTSATIIGYGQPSPGVQQSGTVTLLGQQFLNGISVNNVITAPYDTAVQWMAAPANAANGDSGGPVVQNGQAVGIISAFGSAGGTAPLMGPAWAPWNSWMKKYYCVPNALINVAGNPSGASITLTAQGGGSQFAQRASYPWNPAQTFAPSITSPKSGNVTGWLISASSDNTFSYTQPITIVATVTPGANSTITWPWQGNHDCLQAPPGQSWNGNTCTFTLVPGDEGNTGLSPIRSYVSVWHGGP
jgi:hypothetical protein